MNLFLTKEALYRLSYVGIWAQQQKERWNGRQYDRRFNHWSGRRGSNSRHSAWKAEALPTELLPHSVKNHVKINASLFELPHFNLQQTSKPCSGISILLHPISYKTYLKLVVGGGFEPPKASPTDLQSVPFDHSGTPPYKQLLTLEPAEGLEPPTH